MFNIIIFALLSVFVSADTELQQIVAKNCLGDYVCYIPKECCRQGCCYSPDYIPKTTTPPASGSFIGHWCFWAAITAILAGIACVCSVWRRLKSILFCCRDSARNELAPEHNANGSIFYQAPPPYSENEAIVVLVSPQQTVNGTIKFRQTDDGVVIEGEVTGLTPGLHGFHVHSKGDLSDGCASTGSHYNPFKKQHGAPNDTERHVGDLGNIEADDKGVAKIQITDKVISLRSGDTNILGRAIVVHEGEDDLGKGNFSDSLTTGHAGGRVACGIIGILSESWDWKSSGNTGMPNGLLLVAVLIFSFFTTRWW